MVVRIVQASFQPLSPANSFIGALKTIPPAARISWSPAPTSLPIRGVVKPGPFVWNPHQLYIQRQRPLARSDYRIPRHLRRHRRLSERQQRVGLHEPWRGKCGWQAELHSYVNMRGTRMRGRRTVHNRELLGFHLIPLPIRGVEKSERNNRRTYWLRTFGRN